jgi:NADH:ubiquinone oxidoreductase subunit 2 (subunit N)
MVMYMREQPTGGITLNPSFALCTALFLAAAGTLLLGVFPGPFLDFARASASVIGG